MEKVQAMCNSCFLHRIMICVTLIMLILLDGFVRSKLSDLDQKDSFGFSRTRV